MNEHIKYIDYHGCPLCSPPQTEVDSNCYKVRCDICGVIYITDNAINDHLYIDLSEHEDLPDELKNYQAHLANSKRNEAIRMIKKLPSSEDFPIKSSDINSNS